MARDIFGKDSFAAESDHLDDDVFQFAHIPRPVVAAQQRHRFRREDRAFAGELAEMQNEQRNVYHFSKNLRQRPEEKQHAAPPWRGV